MQFQRFLFLSVIRKLSYVLEYTVYINNVQLLAYEINLYLVLFIV